MATTPRQDLRDGLVVGLIAYVTVAVFYGVFDLVAARGAFYTVHVLANVVPGGEGTVPPVVDMDGVVRYDGIHLAASLLIGVIVMLVVGHGDRHPAQARLAGLVVVAGYFVTVAAVWMLTRRASGLIPWWSIAGANAAAVLAASLYVVWRRPGVARRLAGGP